MSEHITVSSSGYVGIGGYQEDNLLIDQAWTHVRRNDGETFSRSQVALSEGQVSYEIPQYTREETSEYSELQALLARWRREGKGELADRVEFAPNDGESVLEFLIKYSPAAPLRGSFPVSECTFVRRFIQSPMTQLHIR